jgi:uncharacterized protein (DUF2249 family)
MTNAKAALDITPDTKIGGMLENYPQLEQILIEISPTFAKLKNPLLRRTVAKIATLRQAAEIGHVPMGTLINRLRLAAGMSESDNTIEENKSCGQADWIDPAKIVKTFDARPILERGEHPLNYVMKDLKVLPDGTLYELITPFIPAPLIDAAKQKGFKAYTKQEGSELFRTYFAKIS